MVMLRAEDIERIVQNVVRKELEPVKTQLNGMQGELKETRMKVNQMYDAMERQGYQFPVRT